MAGNDGSLLSDQPQKDEYHPHGQAVSGNDQVCQGQRNVSIKHLANEFHNIESKDAAEGWYHGATSSPIEEKGKRINGIETLDASDIDYWFTRTRTLSRELLEEMLYEGSEAYKAVASGDDEMMGQRSRLPGADNLSSSPVVKAWDLFANDMTSFEIPEEKSEVIVPRDILRSVITRKET